MRYREIEQRGYLVPGPVTGRGPVARLADWLRQFDRLSVSAQDWPSPASNVLIQYQPGWSRVLITLGQVLTGGLAVWALAAGDLGAGGSAVKRPAVSAPA